MKNILLSLLCVLGLQSMMMQAAVESKDDYEDQRQAIIDEAMQPENYINLKSGFALLQSQGLNVPSFHDLLEQNVFQSNDEELDLDAITAQAEDIFTSNMKKPFLTKLKIAMEERKTLNQINDPIFKYVMRYKDDEMRDIVNSWLYKWSKTKDYFGWTPLHNAAEKNNAEIVSMLLAADADVNIQDPIGDTPLHKAARNNSVKVVDILLNAGADVNIQDKAGNTPLYYAVDKDNAEVIQMLINAGADANIQNKNGETAGQIVDTHEIRDLFEQDRRKVQNTEAAGNPINLGANLNHETTKDIFTSNMKKSFLTKLEIAMKEKKTLNQINDRIFEYVMQHKDDDMYYMVNSWLYEWSKTKDYFGWTPLHNAAEKNNAEIVSMLLAADADVNIQDSIGGTPLHNAAENNSAKVVDILLNAGANVNSKTNNGWTPLLAAASRNNIELVAILIDAGADVNSKTNNGWTPLHVTAEKNNGAVARMLIDAGADVNIQRNNDGKTAEQLARNDEMRAIFAQARQK